MQQFEEVKRHKPSVIFIPNIDMWYRTLGDSAIRTFTGLLRSLPPTEPVLLLGILEKGPDDIDEDTRKYNAALEGRMIRDLFGYSMKDQFELARPDEAARHEFFTSIVDYIRKPPSDFPEAENRKKRKLAELPIAPAAAEPQGPSKEDLKAQKKKDRQTLNLLKLHIQSVMDQIKLKYRKFRNPVVEDRDIAYLYDEQNPEVLTTDLGEEQRRQQQLFRPYELSKDDKGAPGILEVASGKFYYNLEIVTIEKRLSNGYYKRPKDFLADIKRLAKDAKTLGDQDRTLKANEMLANVEVDMTTLEQTQPALCAECEAVYQREQAREYERLQKEREAQRRGEDVPKVVPNIPPAHASNTTTETSGPVNLGLEVPGGRPPLFPITPSRFGHGPSPLSNPWSTTNGSHPSAHTNGSIVPMRLQQDDSEMMIDTEHQHGSPTSLSQPNTQGQLTQHSAHTRIAQGSQPEHYHNSASTTTSGQKTSSKDRSSGPSVLTQLSNGVHLPGGAGGADHPDFSMLPEARGGSQLPDTQEQLGYGSSSQSSPPYMAHPVPAPPPQQQQADHQDQPRRGSISAVLNPPAETTTTTSHEDPAGNKSRILLDQDSAALLLIQLVAASSGLSVEQLEQVNASMMHVVWGQRGNWNRNQVLHSVKDAFNATVADIEACQRVSDPSQPK